MQQHSTSIPRQRPDGRCRSASAISTPKQQAKQVASVQDVLATGKYKAVLLDQFGVLHDGQQASAQALEAVRQVAARGLRQFIISNSSRRTSGTIDRLCKQMGYEAAWFEGAVTSGELAYQHLLNRPTDWWRTLGRRVLHLTWEARGSVSLEGLNLTVVDHPEEADFILAHGTEAVSAAWGRPSREMSLAQMNQLLERCAYASRVHRPLPMVVANPDLVTVNGKDLIIMPGTLARTYQSLGGPVRIMGKPDRVIFEAALQSLGLTAGEVLVVGDSLQHDIAGAADAGMDSLLVGGGIHAQELLQEAAPAEQQPARGGPTVDTVALQRLCEQHGAVPSYVAPALVW